MPRSRAFTTLVLAVLGVVLGPLSAAAQTPWTLAVSRLAAEVQGPLAIAVFSIGVVVTGFGLIMNKHNAYEGIPALVAGGGLIMATGLFIRMFT